MIIIRNNIIPFKGYKAVNLFGILFCRKNAVLDEETLVHEGIHTKQMVEMLFIIYYLWYGLEYLVRLIGCRNSHTAYRKVSFEQEAYSHEKDKGYLDIRRHYAWTEYL